MRHDENGRRPGRLKRTLLGLLITVAGLIIVVYGLLLIFPDLI